MKKLLLAFTVLLTLAIGISGCRSNGENAVSNLLDLDKKEMKVYESFKNDHSESHLKGLEPLSICKIYLYASSKKDYETEYELYIKDDEHRLWTKAEHLRWSKEEEDIPFEKSMFEDVEELELSYSEDERSCTISWISKHDEFMDDDGNYFRFSFYLIKNRYGVWKVSFMPMQ